MKMRWYHHSIITIALILFIVFFYQDGFGSIPFLIASGYLAIIFLNEMKRQRNVKK